MVRAGLKGGELNNKILILKEVTESPKLVEVTAYDLVIDSDPIGFKHLNIENWIEQQSKEDAT